MKSQSAIAVVTSAMCGTDRIVFGLRDESSAERLGVESIDAVGSVYPGHNVSSLTQYRKLPGTHRG